MEIKIVIVLTFIIYAFTNAANSTSQTENPRNIEEILQEKCNRNTDIINATETFRETIYNFPRCINTALSQLPLHPIKEYDSFCSYLRNSTLYTCVENLTENISPCLDPTEGYLPILMLNVYNSSLETLCGPHGFSNTEYLFNKIENRVCFANARNLLIYEGTCITDLTEYKQVRDGSIDFNKKDFCLDMKSFLNCATNVLDEFCNEDYSIFMRLILKPLLQACNGARKNF